MSLPLQNRVMPDGSLVAASERGLFMGNRGGKIHDPKTRTLHPTKRWASRQWICCVTEFKQRQRSVMGQGYTELFFLDEVTALAAGHRPCFECRRADAKKFQTAWQGNSPVAATAPEIDRVLHQERLDGRQKRVRQVLWANLPDGTMVRHDNCIIAKHANGALEWSMNGYRKITASFIDQTIDCLTPPGILRALENGYDPVWHPSAPL